MSKNNIKIIGIVIIILIVIILKVRSLNTDKQVYKQNSIALPENQVLIEENKNKINEYDFEESIMNDWLQRLNFGGKNEKAKSE